MDELVFTPYQSIANASHKKFVESLKALDEFKENVDWIVTEKIHGANYSLWTNGVGVEPGRRGGFITDETNFFRSMAIRVKYEDRVRSLFKEFPGATTVVVFGELFGGSYPGYAKTVPAIQKGVNYCPGHEFYAFDILVDGLYVDYSRTREIFTQYDFIHGNIEFRGGFEQALAYSHAHNKDPSNIPKMLGFDPTPNNVREGNVIRPNRTFFMTEGSRAILKDKNSIFMERSSAKNTKTKRDDTLTEEEQKELELVLSFVTEARLSNVLSKFGIPAKKDINELVKQLCEDSIDEYQHETNKSVLPISRRHVLAHSRKLVTAEVLG
jgi:Rnl2 family RNA ligase